MSSWQSNAVELFHKVFKLYVSKKPELPNMPLRKLRVRILEEEFNEYLDAEQDNNIVEIADALGDMLYIIYGTALTYGIPLDTVFAEIQRSNMSKLSETGAPIIREDGKILKGPNYFKPDISYILKQHCWEGEEK